MKAYRAITGSRISKAAGILASRKKSILGRLPHKNPLSLEASPRVVLRIQD